MNKDDLGAAELEAVCAAAHKHALCGGNNVVIVRSWLVQMKTLTWKKMLLTQHQRKPSFACTCALPFSCLHMHFAVCCLLPDHALDFDNHILHFPVLSVVLALLLSWGALARVCRFLWLLYNCTYYTIVPCKESAVFVKLCLVKTQARPTPPAVTHVHIAWIKHSIIFYTFWRSRVQAQSDSPCD